MVTRADIEDFFTVDLITGKFFWKNPTKYHPRLMGMEAGSPQENRKGKFYWVIKIFGKHYKRGRLMFLYLNERWPVPCVDHEDGNSLNDTPKNLREATVLQNAQNHKTRAKSSDLPMGVRSTASGRFQARITFEKRPIVIGTFDTPHSASAQYIAKRLELFGEFA